VYQNAVLSRVLNGDNNGLVQTNDGTAVMSHEKGEQSVITQPYWNAYFMHCYAHQFSFIVEILEL
jgi:hypothetical protein